MKVMQRAVYGRVRYELTIEEVEPGDEVRRDGYTLAAVGVEHRIPALAWVLWEDERPGEFDVAEAERLGVAPGPDFGRLQRGETVGGVAPDQVVGPARAGRKLVVSGDTAPSDSVRGGGARGGPARPRGHLHRGGAPSAPSRRATHGRRCGPAGPGRRGAPARADPLSTRYGGREIRDEARAVFERTVVPRDFDAIEIPFPERGEPGLVRFEEPVAG